MRAIVCIAVLATFSAVHAVAASAVRHDVILIQGNESGNQTVATAADGTVRAEYSYNDRGRGDHIVATWKTDANGVPVEYSASGNDYMKAPVEEHFSLADGVATWKSRAESGSKPVKGRAGFYVPNSPPPEFYGVLARALLKAPNRTLALLPEGKARIEPAGHATLKSGKRVDLPGAPAQLPARGKAPRRAAYTPSPADFPRIDPGTQKRRDDIRRQVLQDELSSERRNADEARRQLTLGERLQPGERATDATYLDRVSKLRTTVQQHDQNITSIQRELANLK